MGARESVIPLRGASLANIDGIAGGLNGIVHRSNGSLRIDTDMANGGRANRNTMRPSGGAEETDGEDEMDIPGSAATDFSMSESEAGGLASARGRRDRDAWNGALSAVVGLQKRGLRGLMEGRRMRERGRSDGDGLGVDGGRVGLGIA